MSAAWTKRNAIVEYLPLNCPRALPCACSGWRLAKRHVRSLQRESTRSAAHSPVAWHSGEIAKYHAHSWGQGPKHLKTSGASCCPEMRRFGLKDFRFLISTVPWKTDRKSTRLNSSHLGI